MTTDLQSSKRFQPPPQRRDFLGLASLGSAAAAMGFALIGALRLPMPSIFPESNSRVKLGPAEKYLGVEMTVVSDHRLWIFSDSKGLYAISAICTHLGCIVAREGNGQFHCPCHGSQFDVDGKVIGGPAPKPLARLDLQIAPDGQLVVDTQKHVAADTRLEV